MKKLVVIVLSIIIVATASAQVKGGGHYYGGGGRYYHPHTRVIVGLGAGYYSPYYYYPFYPPYYGYARPSRLELKIEDIQADYRDRIYSARHDKSISKSERKATIRQLKSDRELAIRDAKRNYYKSYDNRSPDNSSGASSER
jgi:hypothetical protein